MIKLFKSNLTKRAVFPKRQQTKFLLNARKVLNFSQSDMAKEIKIHPRTFSDWEKEKYSIPISAIKKICELSNLKQPDFKTKDQFWYTSKSGKIGGCITYKKYGKIGDHKTRKENWLKWWGKTGKYNLPENFKCRNITIPKKDERLAEFVGIMIGDGGISQRQIRISLNSKTDLEYAQFVIKLLEKIFKLKPAFYSRPDQNVADITISRTLLVQFCQSIGLKKGNKLAQNMDIPDWIKNNQKFSAACLRGLMDTDGGIFGECHTIKDKKYCYPRLSIVSMSPNLRLSMHKIFLELDFSAKIRNNRSVQLEKREDILKYFKIIKTHNPKHKSRLETIIGRVG